MAGRELTPREKVFVETYLETRRPGFAYITAYNTKSKDPKAVNHVRRARIILGKPHIKALVAAAKREVAVRTEDHIIQKYAATKERLIEECARIAFTDATEIMTWDKDGVQVKDSAELGDAAKAIVDVQEHTTKTGKKVQVKIADKRAAIETLAKLIGALAPEKHDHRVAVNFIIEKD